MIAQLLQSQSCAHDASKNGANAALSFYAFTRSFLPRSSAHFAPVCLCVLVRDTLQAWCAVRRMQGAAGQGHVRMRRGGGQPVVGAQLAGEQEEGRLLPRHSSVTLPYKDFPASRRLRRRRGCAIHRRRGWSWCDLVELCAAWLAWLYLTMTLLRMRSQATKWEYRLVCLGGVEVKKWVPGESIQCVGCRMFHTC